MAKTTNPNGDIEWCRQNPDKLDRARRQSVNDLANRADVGSNKRPTVEKRDEIPSQRIAPKSRPCD